MNFDQMMGAWLSQDTAPPYDVNREALRQALEAEETNVRRSHRNRRRVLWFLWLFGTGMAIFAGFWIAITIANDWPAIYAITSAASFGMFAAGVGAVWVSRGRKSEPERKFDNTLEEEVRRSLALVEYQLSITRHVVTFMIGAGLIFAATFLFAWTTNSSQDIPQSSSYWSWWKVLVAAYLVWATFKVRNQMRAEKPKLELRQRRLRELLAAFEAREPALK